MTQSKEFGPMIDKCIKEIAILPTGEIKYYLNLLVHSIKKQDTELTREFLDELVKFIATLKDLNSSAFVEDEKILQNLVLHYRNLHHIAQHHTFSAQIKKLILQLSAIIAGILLGVGGGLIGATVGLARGIWNLSLTSPLVGLITGFWIGAMFGFRAPKHLFKDELHRQIRFGLDGLHDCLLNLSQSHLQQHTELQARPFSYYFEREKTQICHDCFNDNEQQFQQFLKQEINYSINSFKAGFIGGEMLHGYLGHHFYIQIEINKKPYLIEFTNGPADPASIPEQNEQRSVTGEKIIEMLALHQKLKETNPCSISFILTKMKPGERDCFSYINTVLIGTSQKPTLLNRYENMNPVGQMIGFFVNKMSAFKPDIMTTNPTISI